MATIFHHTSRTKGVTFNRVARRWIGQFMLNGRRHYVGCFKEEAVAVQAVNRARVNAMTSSSQKNEVKEMLEWEKSKINKNAGFMSPVKEWADLTLRDIKDHAANNGITPDDVDGDKRCRENWIKALESFEVRPMTEKEPEIDASIREIDDLISYLDKDVDKVRKEADKAVLDLPEEEWAPCAGTNEKNPAYYWCNSGFLYTVYPAEGYTIWRYDESVPSNNKPIGVWIGPEMDEDEDHLERPYEVTVDKEAGTYSKTVRVSEGAAEEVDEEAPLLGQRVTVCGLINRVEFNGARGVAADFAYLDRTDGQWDRSSAWYTVILDNEGQQGRPDRIRVRPINLAREVSRKRIAAGEDDPPGVGLSGEAAGLSRTTSSSDLGEGGGSPPIEDRVNVMLEIARMKRAKRWMEELAGDHTWTES